MDWAKQRKWRQLSALTTIHVHPRHALWPLLNCITNISPSLSLQEVALSPGKNDKNNLHVMFRINFLPTFIRKVNFLGGQVNFLSSLARGKSLFKKILDPCASLGWQSTVSSHKDCNIQYIILFIMYGNVTMVLCVHALLSLSNTWWRPNCSEHIYLTWQVQTFRGQRSRCEDDMLWIILRLV